MATKANRNTPTAVRVTLSDRAQRKRGWTVTRQRAFLTALAETSNVRAACAKAGLTPTAAYQLRQRDADFADRWTEAMVFARERLDAALFAHALRAVHETGDDGAAAETEVVDAGAQINSADVQLALALLARHRAAVEKPRAAVPRGCRAAVTAAQTDALLRKKLDALARKLEKGA